MLRQRKILDRIKAIQYRCLTFNLKINKDYTISQTSDKNELIIKDYLLKNKDLLIHRVLNNWNPLIVNKDSIEYILLNLDNIINNDLEAKFYKMYKSIPKKYRKEFYKTTKKELIDTNEPISEISVIVLGEEIVIKSQNIKEVILNIK